jgi:MFS family permease
VNSRLVFAIRHLPRPLRSVSKASTNSREDQLALASQKLALSHPGQEAALTSAAIIVAQLATIPVALLAGWANVLGRKPLLVAAFLALPTRALIFAYANHPLWILAGQILDGLGGGLFDALLPLVLADIMRGTGRYNVSRGLVSTVQESAAR